MRLPVIGAEALARLLPMAAAIDALEAAFDAERLPDAPQRMRMETPAGGLLLMPAAGAQGVGVKLITLTPSNPGRGLPFIHGVYVMFDAETQVPEAVIDGGALTAIRTGAVSGLATRYLANPDASRFVIFGAGVQASSHLDAMRAVRPLARVTVVSRSRGPAEALAERARGMGLEAAVGDADAVAEADLVCTCTTSDVPVFEGSLLQPGAHVNAVGAYRPETRELDDEVMRRGRLVVETRQAALAEAGDVKIAIAGGVITADDIRGDLFEVVGGASVRRGPEDVTVFKSVGIAFEDLVVARAAVERLG